MKINLQKVATDIRPLRIYCVVLALVGPLLISVGPHGHGLSSVIVDLGFFVSATIGVVLILVFTLNICIHVFRILFGGRGETGKGKAQRIFEAASIVLIIIFYGLYFWLNRVVQ